MVILSYFSLFFFFNQQLLLFLSAFSVKDSLTFSSSWVYLTGYTFEFASCRAQTDALFEAE